MLARILSQKEIAKDTMLVDLEVEEKVKFEPGQYVKVTFLNPPFPDARKDYRYFCLVNSPTQAGILTIAMRYRESGFKKSLRELPTGSEVQIEGFWGDLLLPSDLSQLLVFIAGGIGITPFMSMLRFMQEKKMPYQITLLYSNPNEASTAFREELQAMAKLSPNFKLVLTMTNDPGWSGEKRRIDAQFIKDYVRDYGSAIFYAVGPPAMVATMLEALGTLGVSEANIRTELFSGY